MHVGDGVYLGARGLSGEITVGHVSGVWKTSPTAFRVPQQAYVTGPVAGQPPLQASWPGGYIIPKGAAGCPPEAIVASRAGARRPAWAHTGIHEPRETVSGNSLRALLWTARGGLGRDVATGVAQQSFNRDGHPSEA